jgi:hypothetical protein
VVHLQLGKNWYTGHQQIGKSGALSSWRFQVLASIGNDKLAVVGVNTAEKRKGGALSLAVPFYTDEFANVAIPTSGLFETLKALTKKGY